MVIMYEESLGMKQHESVMISYHPLKFVITHMIPQMSFIKLYHFKKKKKKKKSSTINLL